MPIWVACLLLSPRALHLLTFKLMRFQHTGSACSRCTPINPSSGGVSHLQILILLFSLPCSCSFGSPGYRSIAMLLTSGGGCCDPNVCPDVWPLSCLLCLSCACAPPLVLLSTLLFTLIELLVCSFAGAIAVAFVTIPCHNAPGCWFRFLADWAQVLRRVTTTRGHNTW